MLNQKMGKPLGFANPLLYGLSATSGALRDITQGNNNGFTAGPGWDACSGLGRPDGARLYPAMPYTAYAKMSDEDLQDLFAYLQSGVAPTSQEPPANAIPWPLGIRWPLAFWNIAFLEGSRLVADPVQDAAWNRGAYLVEALEHCGECHPPRRVTQNLNNSQKFAGTVTQGWCRRSAASLRPCSC